jgi:hypothetical protein
MKKYIAIILALLFVFTVAIVGCEKKAEAPKPAEQPRWPQPLRLLRLLRRQHRTCPARLRKTC